VLIQTINPTIFLIPITNYYSLYFAQRATKKMRSTSPKIKKKILIIKIQMNDESSIHLTHLEIPQSSSSPHSLAYTDEKTGGNTKENIKENKPPKPTRKRKSKVSTDEKTEHTETPQQGIEQSETPDAKSIKKRKTKKAPPAAADTIATCFVCVNPYNKSSRRIVTCLRCKYSACRECYRVYFLGTVNEPQCMQCHAVFSYVALYANFTQTFVRDILIPYRAETLLNSEKSRLANTMEDVKAQQDYEKKMLEYDGVELKVSIAKQQLGNLHTQLQTLHRTQHMQQYVQQHVQPNVQHLQLPADPSNPQPPPQPQISSDDLKDQRHKIKTAKNELKKLYVQLSTLKHEVNALKQLAPVEQMRHQIQINRNNENIFETKQQGTKKTFTWPCPVSDCKGYLDEEYKCGLCQVVVCEKCHQRKEDDDEHKTDETKHKCNDGDVETVKELKKSTRQCPNCRVLIFKISGCDQMWCTKCYTPFSFKTGEIISGRIHNPHYYEHMRTKNALRPEPNQDVLPAEFGGLRQGVVPGEGCGLPDLIFVTEVVRSYDLNFQLEELHRQIGHIEDIVMHRLRRLRDFYTPSHAPRFMRILHMLGRLNEKEWKTRLVRNDKDAIYAHEMMEIYHTFCQSAAEHIAAMVRIHYKRNEFHLLPPRNRILEHVRELIELIKITNNAIYKVHHNYSVNVDYVVLYKSGHGNRYGTKNGPLINRIFDTLSKYDKNFIRNTVPLNLKVFSGLSKLESTDQLVS